MLNENKKNETFQPVINRISINIIQDKKKSNNEKKSIEEKLILSKNNTEKFLKLAREEKDINEMKDCTFKPIIYTTKATAKPIYKGFSKELLNDITEEYF